ncbi:MAG: 4-alpha-glucanotransferase [Pseudomonadota bacterium]
MTDQGSLLFELADAAGIEPGYSDIFGTHNPLSEGAAKAILASLGLPAEDEGQQRESLAALRERPWRQGLAPTIIVPAEDETVSLDLHLPADVSVADWRLVEEGGSHHSGHIDLSSCAPDQDYQLDGQEMVRRACTLPIDLREGYHRLAVTVAGRQLSALVVVAPRLCWQPEDAAPGRRLWGVACQLYSLRGKRSGGIGTYRDLADLARAAADAGADSVGLNPLHALNPADPDSHSPYSPASRDFLNILYIDPFDVPEVTANSAAMALLSSRRRDQLASQELIDYRAVTDLQLSVLRAAFSSWLNADAQRRKEFDEFRERASDALEAFGRFMALQAVLSANDLSMLDCRNWPVEVSRSDSPGVDAFAAEHADEVSFQIWMQWLADQQLNAAASQAEAAGMAVGLYRDLAVGVGPASAAIWAAPERFVRGIGVGAPPDLLNRLGQNWGLSPFNPLTLADTGYAAWIEALRTNMAHAGALRIDHAMALLHGYWVPDGFTADKGAYIAFPFDDLCRILALESRRNRCLVIGEDLGTVPPGFREAMAASGVLSYRVMMFERVGEDLFARAETYPEDALVTFGTHDLPTLAGFWTGADLAVRRHFELYPSEEVRDADAADRIADRRRLIDALIDAGVWPADPPADSEQLQLSNALIEAIQRYLAKTPSRLMMVQLEDLLGLPDMMNLPGTVHEHPNWRRRLPVDIETLFSASGVKSILAAIDRDRRDPIANDYQ